MSRISYVVYVVTGLIHQDIVTGFTVKHELATWLRKQDNPHHYLVIRVPDNAFPGREPTVMSVDDLLKVPGMDTYWRGEGNQ